VASAGRGASASSVAVPEVVAGPERPGFGNTTPRPTPERVQLTVIRRPSSGGSRVRRPSRSRARRCSRASWLPQAAAPGAKFVVRCIRGQGWRSRCLLPGRARRTGAGPLPHMCSAPHRARARALGSSSRPVSVNANSTRGGISLKRLRNNSPSATICCRCLSSTPALIPPGSRRRSSTGRWGRRTSASAISSVQRSPAALSARASATC
jgi:hypothetical protein